MANFKKILLIKVKLHFFKNKIEMDGDLAPIWIKGYNMIGEKNKL